MQSASYISAAVATQWAFRFWGNVFVVPSNNYATVYCLTVGISY
jgi:hypothetical protein